MPCVGTEAISGMADDREDDEPDYRGLDHVPLHELALDRQGDEDGRIFDDGRTLNNHNATEGEDRDFTATTEDGGSKTLMELQHGINGATAQQIIDDEVYELAVLFNFLLVRLNSTSGVPHPRVFAEETRKFMEDKPVFQVKMHNGSPAPYVYVPSQETTEVDDDMRIGE